MIKQPCIYYNCILFPLKIKFDNIIINNIITILLLRNKIKPRNNRCMKYRDYFFAATKTETVPISTDHPSFQFRKISHRNDSINLQRDFKLHRAVNYFSTGEYRDNESLNGERSSKEGGAPHIPFSSRGWVTKFHVRTILSPRRDCEWTLSVPGLCGIEQKERRNLDGTTNPSFTVW